MKVRRAGGCHTAELTARIVSVIVHFGVKRIYIGHPKKVGGDGGDYVKIGRSRSQLSLLVTQSKMEQELHVRASDIEATKERIVRSLRKLKITVSP